MKLFSRIALLSILSSGVLLASCAGQGGDATSGDASFAIGGVSTGSFKSGTVDVSSNPGSIPAGGTATISVVVIDTANGNKPVSPAVQVTFTSSCALAGTATIGATATTNSNGLASTTYKALDGCSGLDDVTATTTIDGNALAANGTVTVLASPVASVAYASSSQPSIALKGTGSGLPESTIVAFKVLGANGSPSVGIPVSFSIDTSIGGITFSPTTATTDSNGIASTTLSSGSVPGTVRVTAATGIVGVADAQSPGIVISSGVPDQAAVSISSSCSNIEGATIDGKTTNVTVRMSDRFNTPVPNGTAVNFVTEGGTVQSQCTLSSGSCSVQITSQAPRVSNHRYSVLATALGAENFTDNNGNGRFDTGEPFTDVPEAFLDKDEDGTFDVGEPFIDINGDSTYSAASGDYTGPLCNNGCDTNKSVSVRAGLVIVMSSSDADITLNPTSLNLSSGPVTVAVSVADTAGQPMAGGTTISATTSVGTITTATSFTQPCSTVPGAAVYQFTVAPPGSVSSAQSGTFAITVTSPSGAVTTATAPVQVSPGSSGGPAPSSTLGSIAFVSASPTSIGLKGSGLQENSVVTFKVVSDTGSLLANQLVNFSLSTTTGGITLSNATGTTDSNGKVSTTVQSGTVHTSVKVIASATQGSISTSTQSSQLTISTTLPAQNGMSLSGTLNIEGDGIDGVTDFLTVRLADRYNTPVPDGTAVTFSAEGGAITPSCTTVNGSCNVTFTSSGARTRTLSQDSSVFNTNNCGATPNGLGCDDHRYTILATAIGEESFIDTNGDGVYNNSEPFTNLPEAFMDANESGAFNSACEVPADFNQNGIWDVASNSAGTPTFTGLVCSSSNCDTASTLHVRSSFVVVMSSSKAVITTNPSSLTIAPNTVGSFDVTVADTAGQSMAPGTTVQIEVFSTTGNGAGSTVGKDSFVQPDTNVNGPTTFTFSVLRANGTPPPGSVKITVTSPSGTVTTKSIPLN